MISISYYKIVRKKKTVLFFDCEVLFIYSKEDIALCPNCGETLVFHSRVIRSSKTISGEKNLYSICVLECENGACPTKYHRELPDIITPYKRYDTNTIEIAITDSNSNLLEAPDDSTIKRWREWFKSNVIYIVMALQSLRAVIGDNTEIPPVEIQGQGFKYPIETIKNIVKRTTKWLNETVRLLVNSSKWPFNRSVFLPG
jgi:hypothetical protein